jgi:hypothetical protein
MTTGTMLWAGKRLSDDEELRTRRLVAMLHRAGDDETAGTFERFLPENDHRWTPDELEMGAHVGPWMDLGDVDLDAQSDADLDADAA